jgi:hypothetical protein
MTRHLDALLGAGAVRRGCFPKARNRLNTIFLSGVYVGTRSERRSRMHPVLLQKVYEAAHLRQKQAVAQG